MKRNSSNKTPKRSLGGFTLVELIVVIAILAILAGVGAVAYTGYINYTKQGLDKQTIGEIIHAIELANYDDPSLFEKDATVYITENGIKSDRAEVDAALARALGDLSTVKLAYEGWPLEGFSESVKTGFQGLMDNTNSKANAYWKAVSDNGKTATFAADVDDLWEHFTALKSTKYWKPENMGKAVQMSNEKQDTIISIWTNGTTFLDPSICDVTENVYLALSMARNYSFAAYAEKNAELNDKMKEELETFKLSSGMFGAEMVLKGKSGTDSMLKDSGWAKVIAAYYDDADQLKADALGYLAIMEAANVIADGKPTEMKGDEFLDAMEPHLATVSGALTKGKSALEAAMAVTGENAQILVAKNADGTVTCKVYPRDLDPRKDGSNGSTGGEASNVPTQKTTSATVDWGSGTITTNSGTNVIAVESDGTASISFPKDSLFGSSTYVTGVSINGESLSHNGTADFDNGSVKLQMSTSNARLTFTGGTEAGTSTPVELVVTCADGTSKTFNLTFWVIE